MSLGVSKSLCWCQKYQVHAGREAATLIRIFDRLRISIWTSMIYPKRETSYDHHGLWISLRNSTPKEIPRERNILLFKPRLHLWFNIPPCRPAHNFRRPTPSLQVKKLNIFNPQQKHQKASCGWHLRGWQTLHCSGSFHSQRRRRFRHFASLKTETWRKSAHLYLHETGWICSSCKLCKGREEGF